MFWALRIIDDAAFQKNPGRVVILLRRCGAARRLGGLAASWRERFVLVMVLARLPRGRSARVDWQRNTAYVTTGIKSG